MDYDPDPTHPIHLGTHRRPDSGAWRTGPSLTREDVWFGLWLFAGLLTAGGAIAWAATEIAEVISR